MRKPKARLDPRVVDLDRPLFDQDAITCAHEALAAMNESMEQWLEVDIDKLQQARLAAESADWTLHSIAEIEIAAYELKGMGDAYGFPLATQLAASLCRLIGTDAGKRAVQHDPALARAHIDALRAVVREGIRDDSHPVGCALVRALDGQVARLGVASS